MSLSVIFFNVKKLKRSLCFDLAFLLKTQAMKTGFQSLAYQPPPPDPSGAQ